MTRQHPEAPAIAGLCFLACAGMVAFLALAQLFGKFRHVAPLVREWLLVNVDAAHQVVAAWIA